MSAIWCQYHVLRTSEKQEYCCLRFKVANQPHPFRPSACQTRLCCWLWALKQLTQDDLSSAHCHPSLDAASCLFVRASQPPSPAAVAFNHTSYTLSISMHSCSTEIIIQQMCWPILYNTIQYKMKPYVVHLFLWINEQSQIHKIMQAQNALTAMRQAYVAQLHWGYANRTFRMFSFRVQYLLWQFFSLVFHICVSSYN